MPHVSSEVWRPAGVDDLEPAAWRALRHEGNACIVAGPGAGKTELLAQRACFLLDTGGCRYPRRILAISFKRDAATNLAKRVRSRARGDATRFVSMTFDQFTKGIVDRFRASLPTYWALDGPYEIQLDLSKRKTIEWFLDQLGGTADAWREQLYQIPRGTFLTEDLGSYRLPADRQDPTSAVEYAVASWWDSLYVGSSPQRVEFTMLNRLAELIIRANPQIRRALRLTFPYVFVDEFQDTTFAQYDFLRSVFGDDSGILTVVGDNKQRIMGFAGAMTDAASAFQIDWDAERFELLMNFRSSEALVQIQHVVARALDRTSAMATSGSSEVIDGEAAQIWRFATEVDEARHISQWIAGDMASSGRTPCDYALLTKQKAQAFEQVLAPEFARHGVALRNDSARIGKTTLQDLLVDDFALLVVGLMRLAATQRDAATWNHVCAALSLVRGAGRYDGAGNRSVADDVSFRTKRFRKWMSENPPNADTAKLLVDKMIEFVDREAVRRAIVSYRDNDALDIAEAALRLRLSDVVGSAVTWIDVCDAFEGLNAVPLMTVHKSKGLEYHTVIFLGIDDQHWWSHSPGQREGQATFFVGLSRAEQRAMFTFCEQRGERDKVRDLYDLLRTAGVVEHRL